MNPSASVDEGGYFEFETHERGAPARDPWRSMSELGRPSAAWAARIADTRTALAASVGLAPDAVEQRVAASVAHLGLCARIVAPALAAAVQHSRVIDTALDTLWWQPALGGPFPLSVPDSWASEPVEDVISALRDGLIGETISAITAAVQHYSVSTHVAWGNAASAIHGATRMLRSYRPDLAADVTRLCTGLVAAEHLAGTGDVDDCGQFRRRSCCLIYRVGGGRTAVCGDCVLRPE